jgi:hypothetical protein
MPFISVSSFEVCLACRPRLILNALEAARGPFPHVYVVRSVWVDSVEVCVE